MYRCEECGPGCYIVRLSSDSSDLASSETTEALARAFRWLRDQIEGRLLTAIPHTYAMKHDRLVVLSYLVLVAPSQEPPAMPISTPDMPTDRPETDDPRIETLRKHEKLSARTANILTRAGIMVVSDLARSHRVDLAEQRNCGRAALQEIDRLAQAYGIEIPGFDTWNRQEAERAEQRTNRAPVRQLYNYTRLQGLLAQQRSPQTMSMVELNEELSFRGLLRAALSISALQRGFGSIGLWQSISEKTPRDLAQHYTSERLEQVPGINRHKGQLIAEFLADLGLQLRED